MITSEMIKAGAKRGRPKKNPARKKSSQFRLRLTKNELGILKAESEVTGLPISQIIRGALDIYFTRDRMHDEEPIAFVDYGIPGISMSRVTIRYAEDGGTERDGVIELRRGVEELTLGESSYAQVRIKLGQFFYIKGMAVYSDDLPEGADIRFNTNKPKGTPYDKIFKSVTEGSTDFHDSVLVIKDAERLNEWVKNLDRPVM